MLLQNTVFGYVVSGNLDPVNEIKAHCDLIRDEDLNKTLKKFLRCRECRHTNNEKQRIFNLRRTLCTHAFQK